MSLDDLPVVGDYPHGAPPKPERGAERKKKRLTRTRADQKFREEVRQRDGYHCRDCQRPVRTGTHPLDDNAAHVHHIVARNVAPHLKRAMDNAITLCSRCHLARHGQRKA